MSNQTPDNITELEPNQIFVFGSNLDGAHIGGAAHLAHQRFGAEWGVGVGLTGQCYAIPTMHGMDKFEKYAEQFLRVASLTPDHEYLLTKVGCGIAGYGEQVVKQLFKYAPPNVIKPAGW